MWWIIEHCWFIIELLIENIVKREQQEDIGIILYNKREFKNWKVIEIFLVQTSIIIYLKIWGKIWW